MVFETRNMVVAGVGPGICDKVLTTGRAEQILKLADRNAPGRIRLSGLAPLHRIRGAQVVRAREGGAGITPALGERPNCVQHSASVLDPVNSM